MLKKRTLLLEKVYETRIMFFSSSFYCMDNLQDLAGYRVSMDRENNKNKGNTLGRNKTKAGGREDNSHMCFVLLMQSRTGSRRRRCSPHHQRDR
jgi:hypothetical protein